MSIWANLFIRPKSRPSENEQFQKDLEALKYRLVHTPGGTSPAFRQTAIRYANDATLGNLVPEHSMPDSIRQLVDKVVFAPYSIEDEDFERALKELKSEDAVLEVIYCAVLGAGLCRHELINCIMIQSLMYET